MSEGEEGCLHIGGLESTQKKPNTDKVCFSSSLQVIEMHHL